MLFIDDERVGFADQFGSQRTFLFKIIKVFEKQNP